MKIYKYLVKRFVWSLLFLGASQTFLEPRPFTKHFVFLCNSISDALNGKKIPPYF